MGLGGNYFETKASEKGPVKRTDPLMVQWLTTLTGGVNHKELLKQTTRTDRAKKPNGVQLRFTTPRTREHGPGHRPSYPELERTSGLCAYKATEKW